MGSKVEKVALTYWKSRFFDYINDNVFGNTKILRKSYERRFSRPKNSHFYTILVAEKSGKKIGPQFTHRGVFIFAIPSSKGDFSGNLHRAISTLRGGSFCRLYVHLQEVEYLVEK